MYREAKECVKDFLPLKLLQTNWLNLNEKRIFITVSMKRSGQHAVLHWFCKQLERVIHFNNCFHKRMGYKYAILPTSGRIVTFDGSTTRDTGKQSQDSLKALLRELVSYNDLLYSFEDFDIEDKLLRRLNKKYHPTFLLICRDPYNWLASRIALFYKDDNEIYQKKQEILYKISLWKKLVKQSLGESEYLPFSVVSINYNKWVLDLSYRQEVCSIFGTNLIDDRAKSYVPDFGEGSSFDKRIFDGKNVEEMKVLERWKVYSNSKLYRSFFDDMELRQLATEYFQMPCPFD